MLIKIKYLHLNSVPVKKDVYFEGTLGVKNNTPWAGPRMTATLGKWKIVLWTVISAGWAGDPDWTVHSLLDYESISYAANSKWEFGFTSVRYQKDDRKNVPSLSYKLPVGPTEVKGQASYDLTNDDPMFWLGVKYLFGK
ncbi:MAG TPA: hypothetical protein PK367_02325 [Candidatus Paceibacterota bacterium]|nr:hypothetical protein [Candidatus Paceibacterota bacterium]